MIVVLENTLVLIRQLDGVQFGDGDLDGTPNDIQLFQVGNGCSHAFGGTTLASMLGGRRHVSTQERLRPLQRKASLVDLQWPRQSRFQKLDPSTNHQEHVCA